MSHHDFYIHCPGCRQELRVRKSARSGVTSNQWSDGFVGQEPRKFSDFSSCPQCHKAFWVSNQVTLEREVGQTPRDLALTHEIIDTSGNAPFEESRLPNHGELCVHPASTQQMIVALSSIDLPLEQEYYLREVIWHRGNHEDRGFDIDPEHRVPEDFRLTNLRHLLAKHESKVNEERDVVIEGELLREMEQFDTATERMAEAIMSGSTRAVIIHQQIAIRSAKVCIVREGNTIVIY